MQADEMAHARGKGEPASKLVKNKGEPTGIQGRRNEDLRKCLKEWPKTKIEFTVKGWQKRIGKINRKDSMGDPGNIPRQ